MGSTAQILNWSDTHDKLVTVKIFLLTCSLLSSRMKHTILIQYTKSAIEGAQSRPHHDRRATRKISSVDLEHSRTSRMRIFFSAAEGCSKKGGWGLGTVYLE